MKVLVVFFAFWRDRLCDHGGGAARAGRRTGFCLAFKPGGTGRVPTNWAVNAVLRHDLGTLIGLPIGGAMMTYLWKADS
jgi:hypothetical protein